MAKKAPRHPVTPAVRVLRAAGVEFVAHLYDYVERGGVAHSSSELGWPPHQVIKTLVMRDDQARGLLVLMHGDKEVSTRELARQLGHKHIEPCTPQQAEKHTRYLVGGTSPFGSHEPLPVYVEQSVLELPRVLVNGGKRGFLVELQPQVFVDVLAAQPVQVAR